MMKWLMNLNVGARLISAFVLVAAISVAVGAIGIVNMSKINDLADDMYEQELLGLSHIKDANINLIYMGRARSNFLLAGSNEEREKHQASIAKSTAAMNDNLARARPLFTSERGKEILASIDTALPTYHRDMQEVLALAGAQKAEERDPQLMRKMTASRVGADRLDALLGELTHLKETRAKQAAAATANLYHGSRAIMLGLIAAALLLGVAIGALITRGLLKQLGGEPKYAAELAAGITAGDLSTPVVTKTNDTSSMLFAMKEMRDSLVNIVGQVRSGTETIATASAQIAAGNQDLSARTEQQASSLEETAASMEELTSTVKQNAGNAQQANQLAQSASAIAVKGGTVVAQVVDTMTAINDSSKKIVDIIGVIDGIAFQTNILALNAAVEAARAGEQGRGFAVVAAEVRNLAHRSAAAAKEIKGLIAVSVENVDKGARLVNEAGATMEQIVGSVKRVTDIIGEISNASDEQSRGIEQMNEAISQMDQVTQQNAALVEQAAAAAESMQEQAGSLSEVVSIFRLQAEQGTALAGMGAPSRPAPQNAARRAAITHDSGS